MPTWEAQNALGFIKVHCSLKEHSAGCLSAEHEAPCQGCEVGWALSPHKRANTGTEEPSQDEER